MVLLARRQKAGISRSGDSPSALIEGKCGNGNGHREWEAKLRNSAPPDVNPPTAVYGFRRSPWSEMQWPGRYRDLKSATAEP
jgi:hypothetical protein